MSSARYTIKLLDNAVVIGGAMRKSICAHSLPSRAYRAVDFSGVISISKTGPNAPIGRDMCRYKTLSLSQGRIGFYSRFPYGTLRTICYLDNLLSPFGGIEVPSIVGVYVGRNSDASLSGR